MRDWSWIGPRWMRFTVRVQILELAAFTRDPAGGNPAGVVLDADGMTEAEMLAIAARLGHSETAFLSARTAEQLTVRYFSPLAEVPFCGHATIAAAVALHRPFDAGPMRFDTPVGAVMIDTAERDGVPTAAFTTGAPRVQGLGDPMLGELLELLRLTRDDLDPALPPALAAAGSPHPLLAVRREAFDGLDYDFDGLAALMAREAWPATVAVVHRVAPTRFLARNPFPPGGVREDPATGSAAAALGAYLRETNQLDDVHDASGTATITVVQGAHVGRPSTIVVEVPRAGGVRVSGAAVPL